MHKDSDERLNSLLIRGESVVKRLARSDASSVLQPIEQSLPECIPLTRSRDVVVVVPLRWPSFRVPPARFFNQKLCRSTACARFVSLK